MKKRNKIIKSILLCFGVPLIVLCSIIFIHSVADRKTSDQAARNEMVSASQSESVKTEEVNDIQLPDYEGYTKLVCGNNENPMYYRYYSSDDKTYVEGYWTIQDTLIHFDGEELCELNVSDMAGNPLDIRMIIMEGLAYDSDVRVWTTNDIRDYENYKYINPENDTDSLNHEVNESFSEIIDSKNSDILFNPLLFGEYYSDNDESHMISIIGQYDKKIERDDGFRTSYIYENVPFCGIQGTMQHTIEFWGDDRTGRYNYESWTSNSLNKEGITNEEIEQEINTIVDYLQNRLGQYNGSEDGTDYVYRWVDTYSPYGYKYHVHRHYLDGKLYYDVEYLNHFH